MTRKCVELLKNLIHTVWFRIKLWEMDDLWHYTGGSCFGLFPPSFYYTHSEEEIDRIMEETRARIQALIDEMD